MLVLGVAGVLVVLTVALGLCIRATVAHARAQAVADLSALAAARNAQRVTVGEPGIDPCARAAEVAVHNGGAVERCVERPLARVAVDAVVSTSLGAAHASALAGPRPP